MKRNCELVIAKVINRIATEILKENATVLHDTSPRIQIIEAEFSDICESIELASKRREAR